MSLLFDSWATTTLTILISLIAIFISWIKWSHTYWSRKGLFTLKPTFFFGSCKDVFTQKQSFADFTTDLYDEIKRQGKEHGGFYFLHMPTYMPVDPNIIKHILQNDFEYFVNRGIYYNEDRDPLGAHLFSLDGIKWKNLRIKLTPTFTSGKMKMMFNTLVKCGDQLVVEMDKKVDKEPIDIKDILGKFTTDIIGSVAFGIECNSLSNPNSVYPKYLKLFFVDDFWTNIAGIITFVAPGFARKLKMKAVNSTLSDFFMKMIKETVEYREKNNVYRKDFMHLLLQLKNQGKLSDNHNILNNEKESELKITFNELAAQAFVFFLAGFETSSTVMTFSLFELAANLEIQDKLRCEIIDVLKNHDNAITYEAIMEMKYLDQVINEALRKYPPLPSLNRICTKDYQIPGTDFLIEKDTKIWVPVLGIHRDPEFYPNPEMFNPDRFSDKEVIQPYTFLPFGEGPRNCIGLRFGLMQAKVGLVMLLKRYKFSVSSNTTLPLKLDPRSFIMTSKGGIWLDYTKV